MGYRHLSLVKRYYIALESKLGKSFNQIACNLGRSQSTISREVNRNRGLRGYRYQQTDRLTQQHHKDKPKAVKLTRDDKVPFRFEVYVMPCTPGNNMCSFLDSVPFRCRHANTHCTNNHLKTIEKT